MPRTSSRAEKNAKREMRNAEFGIRNSEFEVSCLSSAKRRYVISECHVLCHPERSKQLSIVCEVELSKICNELLIFERQNAAERFEDLRTVRICPLLLKTLRKPLRDPARRSCFLALLLRSVSLLRGHDALQKFDSALRAPLRMTLGVSLRMTQALHFKS